MEFHTLLIKTTKEDNYFIGDKMNYYSFLDHKKGKKHKK